MTAANEIEAIIKSFTDWRGERLAQVRKLIKEADPDIIEEVKFKIPSNPKGVPIWYHDGMLCTGETYKKHLRISFTKGPELKDPKGLLNAYRAVIIHEEDKLDEAAFKELVKEAVELNQKKKNSKGK
jgi:hypothetical protein